MVATHLSGKKERGRLRLKQEKKLVVLDISEKVDEGVKEKKGDHKVGEKKKKLQPQLS